MGVKGNAFEDEKEEQQQLPSGTVLPVAASAGYPSGKERERASGRNLHRMSARCRRSATRCAVDKAVVEFPTKGNITTMLGTSRTAGTAASPAVSIQLE